MHKYITQLSKYIVVLLCFTCYNFCKYYNFKPLGVIIIKNRNKHNFVIPTEEESHKIHNQ